MHSAQPILLMEEGMTSMELEGMPYPPVLPSDDVASYLYQSLVEHSQDAIVAMTSEGKIRTFNRAAEEMFQYSREEMIGRSAFQLVPLGNGGELQEKLKRIRCGKSVQFYEAQRMRKDGSIFAVSIRISAIFDEQENLTGFSWILRDVTAQNAAAALIQKLSTVVEQTADSVMITDKAGKVEYVNPAFVTTTGYTKEEAVHSWPSLLKSGIHSPDFYRKLWKTILAGVPFRGTLVNRRKGGALFYTEKTITPLLDKRGEITHFVSTDKDITERKQAELHSETVQRRFAEFFHSSPQALAYCSLDGAFIEANSAFCALSGYTQQELLDGKHYQQLTSVRNWDGGDTHLETVRKTGKPTTYEKIFTGSGALNPVQVTLFPIADPISRATKALGVHAAWKETK